MGRDLNPDLSLRPPWQSGSMRVLGGVGGDTVEIGVIEVIRGRGSVRGPPVALTLY